MLEKKVKIIKHKYYLYKGQLVRVLVVNPKDNRVIIFNYPDNKKYHIEMDTAPLLFVPLFKIGEVAKFLQRSTETLRRYETSQLIPKAKQYSIGKGKIRLYNEKDLMELADFFSTRNLPGTFRRTNSKIDRVFLKKTLETRLRGKK